MKFEEPLIVTVGRAQNVVLGRPTVNGDNDGYGIDSGGALDLGLD